MASDFQIIDDDPQDEPPAEEDRLNLTRIRAIAQERRAAHRRGLWARAIVFLFASLAVMTGLDAIRLAGSRRWVFAAASLAFLILALRAARRLRRRLPAGPPADVLPPDPKAFETLSDGRQYARRLDELHRDP